MNNLQYVSKTFHADTLTAISIFHAIKGEKKVLFESNAKHEETGRYSFIAFDPIAELYGNGQHSTFQSNYGEVETVSLPAVDFLKYKIPYIQDEVPFSFFGGAIGHFNYETAGHYEKIHCRTDKESSIHDVQVYFYETFIVIDHILHTATIVALDLFNRGYTQDLLDQKVQVIYAQIISPFHFDPIESVTMNFQPTIEKETFIEIVKRAKEYIVSGDIFQVVLSQKFKSPIQANPFHLYRKLRTTNASPYMYYLEFGNYTILGTSPESLVKVNGRIVTTNPIAGTKRRGQSKEDDEKIASALLQDEKELAEHRMLVDLGRNDIGKVCEIGSVHVKKYMKIEKYKHVMHIVSEVEGQLKKDLTALDVLKATIPAGTVSGAPKIRAMQIIDKLENEKRGIYAGAIGYVSATGNMDLALAIRTMIIQDGVATVQAGAGVVFDSNPEAEYEETLNKAKALLEVQHDFINR